MELTGKKVLVTGAHGFLGRHVIVALKARGVSEADLFLPSAAELDLRFWDNCVRAAEGQELILHLAGKVGGIGFNQDKPAELFYDNLIMGTQLMEAARQAGAEKFVTLGTICAYPKFTPAPFKEEDLWNGYPEETNAPYGLAKKTLLVQAQAYREQYGMNSVVLFPVNMFGPGDNFDLETSHVIAAVIRKIAEAKDAGRNYVEVWGTGTPTREFLYVEDAARGIILALENYDKSEPVNLGTGKEIAIDELVKLICRLMDFEGEIRWDPSKPDGQPRRLLDVAKAKQEFGFEAEVGLEEGLRRTIAWWLEQGRHINQHTHD